MFSFNTTFKPAPPTFQRERIGVAVMITRACITALFFIGAHSSTSPVSLPTPTATISPSDLPCPSQPKDLLLPYLYDSTSIDVLLPTPFDGDSSGSGSGSGDGLFPYPTTSSSAVLFPTPITPPSQSIYISLVFNDLTQEQYMANGLKDTIAEVITGVLDIVPVIVVDELGSSGSTTILLLYLPGSRERIQAFAAQLTTSNDPEWMSLKDMYALSTIKVITPTHFLDLPWWHWLIIALSLTCALTACLLLISACCCRCVWLRRKKKVESERHRLTKREILYSSFGDTHQLHEREQMVRKVSRISFNHRGHMPLLSHPLAMHELEQLISNATTLYAEYASIPTNMVTMAEVPPGAEEKNRYKDVLPNPHTRVSLFLKFGVAVSDYINANYIRGYQGQAKTYIATQGPLYWTVADFWRMVWEQKCSAIIMVTGLEERGSAKCARYWPDERVAHKTTYEELEVTLKRRVANKHFTETIFLLRHREKMVSREVCHFWFTSWPDHGVPASTKHVIEFLLHSRRHLRDIPGPTVIHCSAGIGRSGVFIGADIGMQQLEARGEVDVLQIVSTMRQDRGGMVQTKEQYLFLHKVLLHYAYYLDEVRRPYKTRMRTLETATEEDEEEEESSALLPTF